MLVGALIGITGSLIAAWLSAVASKRLARATGMFLRADIRVLLFGQELKIDQSVTERWCFIHPGPPGRAAIYPVTIQIGNAGDAPSGELLVTLLAATGILALDTDNVSQTVVPAVIERRLQRSSNELGGKGQISYLLPSLAPKSGISIIEPFILTSTFNRPSSMSVKTKDNVDVTFQYAISYHYVVDISVAPPDQPLSTRSVHLTCITACDTSEAQDLIAKDVSRDLSLRLSRLTRLQRILIRCGKRRSIRYRLVYFGTPTRLADGGLAMHEFETSANAEVHVQSMTLRVPQALMPE